MSYTLSPYLIKHSVVTALIGSKDEMAFARILAASGKDPQSDKDTFRAVRAIVDGDLHIPDISPESYGYGLETICAALGRQPSRGYGLCGFSSMWLEEEAFEILDTLWKREQLIVLPETEYGIPDVFFLTRAVMAERLPILSSLDLSNREGAREAIEEFATWLREAIDANSDMVVFWY